MKEVEKWKRYELTLDGPTDGNPFRDVELSATFDRNNHSITVDGFYDRDGKYVASKTFGGKRDDAFNKIIQTYDGGYAAVGYVSSDEVYLGDTKIESISKTDSAGKNKYEDALKNKDAVLVKFTQNLDVAWAIRLGGTSDEEINTIIEIKAEDNKITVILEDEELLKVSEVTVLSFECTEIQLNYITN